MDDNAPPKKIPRTGEIVSDIKACLGDMEGVAAFICINTGVAGGFEIVLPTGGVAQWEADGVSFDFQGRTPQQIEQGLNQLANLLQRASEGLAGLRGLCGAYQSASKKHARENPVLLATVGDMARLQMARKDKGMS